MSVKERIKKFAKSQERSIVAFEKKSGLNIGYINAIRVSIQPEKIQSIASSYPNLNIVWLLTGEGEMLKSSSITVQNTHNDCQEKCNEVQILKTRISDMEKLLQEKERTIQILMGNIKESRITG